MVIAMDLGGSTLRGALVDSRGRILRRIDVATPRDRSTRGTLEIVCYSYHQLLHAARAGGIKVRAAAIGVPGFILADEGVVLSSPNFPSWKSFSLAATLRKKTKRRFILENDANCAVLGEVWRGAARGKQHVVGLTLGTGIGGGVIVDGHLLRGANGAAAEIGHIQIDPRGPKCGCGNRGCLEALASGSAVFRKTDHSGLRLTEKAAQGNRSARRLLNDIGHALGSGIGSLCFLFDPEVVVLGGRFSGAYPFFSRTLRAEVRRRLKNHPARGVKIVPSSLDDRAGLLGAASLALQAAYARFG